MYMLIEFSGSVIVEAIMLRGTPTHMRVVLSGGDDAIELTRLDSQWFADTGEKVEIQFLALNESEPNTESRRLATQAAG